MSVSGKRVLAASACIGLIAALVGSVYPNNIAHAAQITERSLTLQAGASDGGSKPGGVVNHFFTFDVPSTGNVGSIKFEYCTIASGTCTLPTGVVTTSATLGSQTGATGFTIVNTTNGSPYLTRTAASITGGTTLEYQLATVTNPTATNYTFFVRISTYASTDTTGSPVDSGTVTASTATQIVLSGQMPESLIFCTGEAISAPGGIPDCSTATAGLVNFNQLFSPTDTATAVSQMAASTNAAFGYNITVAGPTMTSGSNTITAMTVAGGGVRGTRQFGMNLKANTTTTSTPAVGTEVAPSPDGTELRGQAATGYDTVDNFKFVSGDTVARSDNGGAGPTNAQIFTATYMVNVPGNQPAGTYTTTLTYVCTATF